MNFGKSLGSRIAYVSLSIALVTAAGAVVAPRKAAAAELRIGAAGTYRISRPAWNNGKIVLYNPEFVFIHNRFPKFKDITCYQYGPLISLRFFERWFVESSFTHTKWRSSIKKPVIFSSAEYAAENARATEWNARASIGYSFFPFLAMSGGMATEIITMKDKVLSTPLATSSLRFSSGKFRISQLRFVPEIGLTFTIPVTDFFTPVLAIAGTFLSGSDKTKTAPWINESGLSPIMKIPVARYYALGMNLSARAVFTVPAAHLSLSVGAHYHFRRYFEKTRDRGLFVYKGSYDREGGVTLSATCFIAIEQPRRKLWIPRPAYAP